MLRVLIGTAMRSGRDEYDDLRTYDYEAGRMELWESYIYQRIKNQVKMVVSCSDAHLFFSGAYTF